MEKLEKEQADMLKVINGHLAKVQYKDPLEVKADEGKPLAKPQDVTWFDDEPPPGAKLEGLGTVQWHWDSSPVASGLQ